MHTQTAVFYLKPELLNRIKASTIDALIIFVLFYLIHSFLQCVDLSNSVARNSLFVLVLPYEPFFTSHYRSSGQHLIGLKVIKEKSHDRSNIEKISFPAAITRFVLKILLRWLSLITIHDDSLGRAIHDRASGSLMVKFRFIKARIFNDKSIINISFC